jgi:small multidrug resistance family-3 protein
MKSVLITLGLYLVTAVAEIVGCYLILLFTHKPGRLWTLPLAVVSLALFGWLLTLHPSASGRVYAAYGGVYIATALLWLWCVDGVRPDRWDVIGGLTCLVGMLVIYFGPRA